MTSQSINIHAKQRVQEGFLEDLCSNCRSGPPSLKLRRTSFLSLLLAMPAEALAKDGGVRPNLAETDQLISKVNIAVLWKKEQIDLAELARLRWVENWKRQRLADHFGISHQSICHWLRRINAKPALGGFKSKPPLVRGR